MKDLHVRDVTADELPELFELNQANTPHVGSISFGDMENLYGRAVYFRVAESAHRIVGFLIAFDPFAEYDSLNFLWFKKRFDSFVYIDRIVVVPDGRRYGVASLLYRDLEVLAGERKVPIMTCEYNLRPQNEISRVFHRSYGFEEVGRQETQQGKKYVSLQVKRLE
ncbi:MAG: GNAT family N-acetyltransferase [Syntrophobacterales bacterium]|nr:MAG: GNAT family N-acetyltransferase [Syntrophobacterales bacterium]